MSSKPNLLPVLIIPGFMSSGLEVRRSDLKESWVGKRLWINLGSLGIQRLGLGAGGGVATASGKGADEDDDDDGDDEEAAAAGVEGAGDDGAQADEQNPETVRQLRDRVEQVLFKNLWLRHLALRLHDMTSEDPSVEIRPMDGLAAVDYLSPGFFTDRVSYVFGPVIRALREAGYVAPVEGGDGDDDDGGSWRNLDAAPYDWRLPPRALEERDGYFTRTMARVEDLYAMNGRTPVVLLCHSLGCRVGHYFLEFANAKSEGWTAKYIHTYMPVGAPHLGAPKALRACVTGDKMGLDVFLSKKEATALGRSFGSAMWLVPETLPPFAPANVFLRREGAFEVAVDATIRGLEVLLEDREEGHRPEKLKLVFEFGGHRAATKFTKVEGNSVAFRGKFTFATGPDGPPTERGCSPCCYCCHNSCCRCKCCPFGCCCCNKKGPGRGAGLVVFLCEPGLQAARKRNRGCRKCLRDTSTTAKISTFLLWFAFYVTYFVLAKFWILLGDDINRRIKDTDGSVLAFADPINMAQFVGSADGEEIEVELPVRDCGKCCKKFGSVALRFRIRWISSDPMEKEEGTRRCVISEQVEGNSRRIAHVAYPKGKNYDVDAASGYNLIRKEGYDQAIRSVEGTYDADPLDPRGLRGPPPVRNVRAIYGINLPTEVGAAYRRRKAVVEKGEGRSQRHVLDPEARLVSSDTDGYVLEGAILKETRSTPQMVAGGERFLRSAVAKDFRRRSGDGTVPYWSLQHVRTWGDDCDVSVTELEGAEHRAILADPRFHRTLVDYVTLGHDAAPTAVSTPEAQVAGADDRV